MARKKAARTSGKTAGPRASKPSSSSTRSASAKAGKPTRVRPVAAKPMAWHATAPKSTKEGKPTAPAVGAAGGYVPIEHTYDVHPGVELTQSWIGTLKEKSGRSLDEWLKLCKAQGPSTEDGCRDWLKTEHKLGSNAAWWIAEKAHRPATLAEDTPEAYLKTARIYVEDMFGGPKAGLRPLYDAIVTIGRSLGKDVKLCPCKTIVPLYRHHVFAQIKPTTRTRIDLGFCLRGVKAAGRLIDTGGEAKKDRITHRVEITSLKDLDAPVRAWMKQAYEADGG